MSIINQMLRDLDARQASSQERAGLPPGLRTLPPSPRHGLPTWGLLAIGVIIGALVVGSYALWFAAPPAPKADTSPLPPAPAQAAAPVAATEENGQPETQQPSPSSLPATTVTPPTATTSAPTPASAPSSEGQKTPAEEKPKRETPAAAPMSRPHHVTASPAAGVDRVERSLSVAAEAPISSPPTVAGSAPRALNLTLALTISPHATVADTPQIDKQPKTSERNGLAENEYRKGLLAANRGDQAAALPALRRALEIDPRHAQARQALLAVLAGLRQWEEVKRVAEQGLTLDPARTHWATLLARLRYEEGDIDGALKILESHAAHAAGDADFHALFAYLLQKQQRPADAAQHYRAALQLRPGEGRWWFGLGLALEASGHADEARASFAKAREVGNLPAEMLGRVEDKLRLPSSTGSPLQ